MDERVWIFQGEGEGTGFYYREFCSLHRIGAFSGELMEPACAGFACDVTAFW